MLGDNIPGSARAAADAGGTRQGVAMQRIAANMISNYQRYALGLHARVSRHKQGHGRASQSDIQGLGRRPLSPDFVIFLLGFSDCMQRQSIFTCVVQGQSGVPWAAQLAFDRKQAEAHQDIQYLCELRRWVAVLTLLQHWSDHIELRSLVVAQLYTKMGRRFSTAVRNLFDVAVLHKFAGVELQTLTDLSALTMTVTPRCTCRARRSREEFRTQRVPLVIGRRKRRVQVPEWVAESKMTSAEAKRDVQLAPIDVSLRYETFDIPPERPELQGIEMFREHKPQCKTARTVPIVARKLQDGLLALVQFLQKGVKSYGEYWGSVGLPAHMERLLPAMCVAWDFDSMFQLRKPSEQHFEALLWLQDSYSAKLRYVRWPELPYVAHRWMDEKEARRQYRLFWTVVHKQRDRADWRHVTAFVVKLVNPPQILLSMSKRFQGNGRMDAVQVMCIIDMIWQYARGGLIAFLSALRVALGMISIDFHIWLELRRNSTLKFLERDALCEYSACK